MSSKHADPPMQEHDVKPRISRLSSMWVTHVDEIDPWTVSSSQLVGMFGTATNAVIIIIIMSQTQIAEHFKFTCSINIGIMVVEDSY